MTACLDDPEIMGVIWRGAFTSAAIASAERTIPLVKSLPNPKDRFSDLQRVLQAGRPETRDFSDNLELLERFLDRFVNPSLEKIHNNCRSEFSTCKLGKPNGIWHADGGKLTLIGVPVGPRPQYIPQRLPGVFDPGGNFKPMNPMDAERLSETLTNDAVLIMKCLKYETGQTRQSDGLVHRRPNLKIAVERADRMVVHFGISSLRAAVSP